MQTAVKQTGGTPQRDRMGRKKTAFDESTLSGRLGAGIYARRTKLALTVERFHARLATNRCHVSIQTLYAWEAGTRPIPLNELPAIARALNTTVRKLLPDE